MLKSGSQISYGDMGKTAKTTKQTEDKHETSIMTSQAASAAGQRRKQWEKKTSVREERSLPRCIEESAKKEKEEEFKISPNLQRVIEPSI